MSGTYKGGLKAGKTNRAKYGDDFYAKIGAKGGKLGYTGGFYNDSERARKVGSKGGSSGWTAERRKKQAEVFKKAREVRRQNVRLHKA